MKGSFCLILMILFVVGIAADFVLAATNLAVNKPTQSSSRLASTPSQAVDGSFATDWGSGSCFANAASDDIPWWQVDLQGFYNISLVKVTVRSDCCPERFHDVAVEVFSDDPTVTPGSRSQLCYWYSSSTNVGGETVSLTCKPNPVEGRYVRLSGKGKQNEQDLLQFCEVQVFGTSVLPVLPTTNLAVNKPTQSSSRLASIPSKAVDGSDATDWGSGSCFAASDDFPWWQVDLLDSYCVTDVKVTLNSDCCPERFHDVVVEVFESDPTETLHAHPQFCYIYEGSTPQGGETVTLTCTNPVRGRFVRLYKKEKLFSNDLLQFCEVQVFSDHFCSM